MYKLTNSTIILRADGASIPADPANTDYAAYLAWLSEGNTPEPADPVDPIPLYVSSLETYFDKVARVKNYDTRFTCALRAGYVGPFQAEGAAFASWMDSCNAYGYQELAKISSGERTVPTIPEFLAELPPPPWPLPDEGIQ